MIRNRSFLIMLVIALPVILIALMGCSPSAQATSTTAPTVAATDAPTAVVESAATPTQESIQSAANNSTTTQAATCIRLNLNTLTQADLQNTIPDFPDRMVREFLEYRPYSSIQQYRREIGKYVGDEQTTEWEQYIYVPVDVNNSDAETLKQIPGVDDTIAASLMAARPFASNDAFLTELAKSVTAQQAVDATCYLSTTA